MAGDSAHTFPPSGGFGLNTGINDAHNLAHKLAWALQNDDFESLETYDKERRPIAELTAEFAMKNYYKQVKISDQMNLSKENLELYQSVVSSAVPSFLQRSVFQTGISIGLNVAALTLDHSHIQKLISSDNANTIRLMFPNLDFNQTYPQSEQDDEKWREHIRKTWDSDKVSLFSGPGTLIPHIILSKTSREAIMEDLGVDCRSLRELVGMLCLKRGKSFDFLVGSQAQAYEEKYFRIKLVQEESEISTGQNQYCVKIENPQKLLEYLETRDFEKGFVVRGDGYFLRKL